MNYAEMPHKPRSYNIGLLGGGHFWSATAPDNLPFWFVQIDNYGNNPVGVMLNNDENCVFTLASGGIQIFNNRDVDITSVKVYNTVSGGSLTSVGVLLSYIGLEPVQVNS